ncbi:PTS transporter subunit EIIC [uncultured Traorella sp.]|uniref:PTS transporter subunit EIIC n=1 Tax=uncultured Traorella sp. TaxID=1929048 RepID=UPI0025E2A3FF|nr:PTS transporter subunit EIIC [uncultured Traorella sp.]
MAKKDYEEMSKQILEFVGGKENISHFMHCVTRLRFTVKDKGLIKKDEIEKVQGVIGSKWLGEQYQIIIGQDVEKVYKKICEISGIAEEKAIDENLDVKKKFTLKSIVSNCLDALTRSFIPLVPVIVAASLIKMIAIVCGPNMLNIMSSDSDIYILFTFVGDAGFYFLPIYMGYTAAKRFDVSPVLGMFAGAILLHPTLIQLVSDGTPFTVYGIPMTAASYASTTIPALLIVWIMSYIERFFKKVLPETLQMVFVPFLTMLIILPIELCFIGPLGSWVGNGLSYVCNAIAAMGPIPSALVCAFIGAFTGVIILFGMHVPLYFSYINVLNLNGSEGLIGPGMHASSMALKGMALGAALKLKGENRSLAISYLISYFIGGVSEPTIYGIGIRYKRPFVCAGISGAIAAIYYVITGTHVVTVAPTSGILSFVTFMGGPVSYLINGLIGGVIAFVLSAVLTYFFGFTKEDLIENIDEL